MPYNYLLNKKLRKDFEMNLENKVIIFDEGHNLPDFAENMVELELKVTDLHDMMIYELMPLLKMINKE